MSASMLVNPTEVSITGNDGISRKFLIGTIPYFNGGREVGTQFLITATPKVGNYDENQKLAEIMLAHTAAITEDGRNVVLNTRDAVANFVPDFKTGIELEAAMLEKVKGFFVPSSIQKYLEEWKRNLPLLLSKALTALQVVSSENDLQPSENSKNTTPLKK